MWFKNLHLFRLSQPFSITPTELEKALAADRYVPCSSQDKSSFGWVKALGNASETLLHAADGQLLLCARKEEKMLPASVIKSSWEEKISEREEADGRVLTKKERQSLKEEVIHSLLPRAFSRTQQTKLWINPEAGFIAVDAGSSGKAEEMLSLLRKSLGSLPVIPFLLQTPCELTMTEWLRENNLPRPFELLEEAELRSPLEHGGIIRCKDQNLHAEEIRAHIDQDKQVTKVGLDFSDSLSFILNADVSLKRLKFSNDLHERNADIPKEDKLARLDADFALMTAELNQLIPALMRTLGGEAISQ